MIGIGVGSDYSLFVVSRFREELTRRGVRRRGDLDDAERVEAIADAVGVAITTSGRTVIMSGVLVAISMCSMFVVNSPVFHEISIGVVAVVVCTFAAALTLLPAVLAALGPRVNAGSLPERWRPSEMRANPAAGGGWARWAHAVMRRPVLLGLAAAAVLVVLAVPLGGLRYGIDLGTTSLGDKPAAQAQRVLDRSFGPGVVSPVQIVVTGAHERSLDTAGRDRTTRLIAALRAQPEIAAVDARNAHGRTLITAVPTVPIDSHAATDLVRHIRSDLVPAAGHGVEVSVGGATAQFVDLGNETTRKVPWILSMVLGLSFCFLLVTFCSLVLPLKAVAMNLLSTAAAIGLTIAAFQWGWGEHTLGFHSVGFLQVYLPITVFVLLFGLSMDYEVFLVRRMRETWLAERDNSMAVANGIEHTARPISAAAAIMVAVFGSFTVAHVLELKEFGLALSAAIALDATLVRLVLVPAFMRLLGKWNWWLPGSAGRDSEPSPSIHPLHSAVS
jgi:RND superfamily putative drug exporter